MNINEQIGRRIKVRRVELGLTQAELATKLSIGQSNLSYIERGERDVS
ncbi:MAG: helix-turn-helix transcriptional regulator, partial [Xanthomonadales bacterium]|nr:helix-turn-helix transcriptional regulator [Xanthomonadales bacterium]